VLEENLAEVAAKTSAQQVVADNLGLAVAVLATGLTGKVVNESARLIIPFVAFIPLATMDLYCIYRELKAVQLTTINKERAEIIADHWINHGSVPGTKYVSAAERLFGELNIVFSTWAIGLTSCFFNSAGENGRIDAAAAHRG
jgi:glutamate N-acetyltransferase/amino-acid N-acetyltransferase